MRAMRILLGLLLLIVACASPLRSGIMAGHWTPKQGETEWPRGKLYGGLLFENAVQATAADLLRECIADDDRDIILHVHDELVLEVPEELANYARDSLVAFMDSPPVWAAGLPLKTDAKIMTRYG